LGKQPELSACTCVLGSGQAGFSGTLGGRTLSWLPHHISTAGQCPGAVSRGGVGIRTCADTMPCSRQGQGASASSQLSQSSSCLLLPGSLQPSYAQAMLTLCSGTHTGLQSPWKCQLMLPHLLWPCMLLLGNVGSGCAGGTRAPCRCPAPLVTLCSGRCVPAQSYPLHAASAPPPHFHTSIPLPTALSILLIQFAFCSLSLDPICPVYSYVSGLGTWSWL